MISVPVPFAQERKRASGWEGAQWIAGLPALVNRFAGEWKLDVSEDPPLWGANALVVLCSRGRETCALKLGWDKGGAALEAAALHAWGGRGAVRLLEQSPENGVLLLERLDSSRTLDEVDLGRAAEVVGRLIRELSIPAPSDLNYSDGWAELGPHLTDQQRALGGPLPQAWVDLAAELAVELIASGGTTLLHTDLHSGNVLAGREGEWVAIDPRVSVGDPERSAPDLLAWRLPVDAPPQVVHEALARMIAAGNLRRDRVEQWTIVRAVGHWLWCLAEDSGLGPEEERCAICAPRCSRILEALV